MRTEIKALAPEIGGPPSVLRDPTNQIEAMTMADKIVVMNAGPPVEQIGSPLGALRRPRRNQFVAGFIGSPAEWNFLPRPGRLARKRRRVSRVAVGGGRAPAHPGCAAAIPEGRERGGRRCGPEQFFAVTDRRPLPRGSGGGRAPPAPTNADLLASSPGVGRHGGGARSATPFSARRSGAPQAAN